MATDTAGDRSAHFPTIERKHGRPVAEWLEELAALGDVGYAEQMTFLRDRHGFSRTHANAVVMTARGSASAKRFADPEAFFASLEAQHEQLARAIFATITERFGDLELVVAWNQPMLKRGSDYVFGLSAATRHLTIAPWGGLSDAVTSRLGDLEANVKTVKVPLDWEIDAELLHLMVGERLAEIDR